jgi:signal peptidase I
VAASQLASAEASRHTALGPPPLALPRRRGVKWKQRKRPGMAVRAARLTAGLMALLVTLVAAVAVAALAAVSIGPRMGWFQVETVLSGSMRPTFSPGDLIVVTPEPVTAVRTGQVITYAIPVADRHVESHRIVRIVHGGAAPVVVTKGDANPTADPWRARLHGPTAWHLRYVVPKLGLLVTWLRSPRMHLLAVVIAPLCLAASWLVRIWSTPERA